MQGRRPRFSSWLRKIPLKKGMATHSSIPDWRIPRTEEPGRLESIGFQESDRTEQLSYTHTGRTKLPFLFAFVVDPQHRSNPAIASCLPAFAIASQTVTDKLTSGI